MTSTTSISTPLESTPRVSGVATLFKSDTRVLLGVRNPHYVNNQKKERSLEIVGGKVELDETPVQAANREIHEEFAYPEDKRVEFVTCDTPKAHAHDASRGVDNVLFVVHMSEDDIDQLATQASMQMSEKIATLPNPREAPLLSAAIVKSNAFFSSYKTSSVGFNMPLRAFNRFLVDAAVRDKLV
jgi:ADP-ribose pyrophosphatase YjhB (NUDIX family)